MIREDFLPSPHSFFWHWWTNGIGQLEGGGWVLHVSWCCHWQRQCKAGGYRKNGCGDSLLLSLCWGFLGSSLTAVSCTQVLPGPLAASCAPSGVSGLTTFDEELYSLLLILEGSLSKTLKLYSILPFLFWSSFLGCEVLFLAGFKPRTSTHSCQAWHPFWLQVSQFIRMNQYAL